MIGNDAADASQPDSGRPWRLTRRLLAIALMSLLATLLSAVLLWQITLPVGLFEDWGWYQDGPARLLADEPLYDRAYLQGPFYLRDPAIYGKFNQSPALAVALLPYEMAVPEEFRAPVWGLITTVMLVASFVLVWPRTAQPLTATTFALIVALAPATWVAFRTANLACAVALGVGLTIIGHRRNSTWLVAAGLLLAGIAKVLPAAPLVLWLIVKHREWRPVAIAIVAGAALTGIALVYQGPSLIKDFVTASLNQLPSDQWTNVSPSFLLSPILGGLATPISLAAAAALVAAALGRRSSDGAALLLLTTASCMIMPTTYVFWWLSPMVVAIAHYGDWIVQGLGIVFDWQPNGAQRQSAGPKLT